MSGVAVFSPGSHSRTRRNRSHTVLTALCRWSAAVLIVALGDAGLTPAAEARTFSCDAGDVACLTAAINAANLNGKKNAIVLGAGVYVITAADPDLQAGPTGLPLIKGTLTIRGEGAGSTVIERSADADSFRLFTVLGDLSLDGVTLRGGGGDDAVNGGAVLAIGRLTVTDSVITGNRAREGGGLEVRNTATIANSTISGNTAIEGGGILVASSQAVLVIKDSTITLNVGDFGGGLVVQSGGTVTVTNCTFARNRALIGGAINEGIAPDAPIPPGTVPPGTATVQSSTIVENATLVAFSGRPINNREGAILVRSTIIANNTPAESGDCPASATSLGFNLIGNPVDCGSFLVSSDIVGDPRLSGFVDDGTPGHGYFPLLSDSPAIDAGGEAPKHHHSSLADCPKTDQIGQPRGGRCDIGAIEFLADRVRVRRARFSAKFGVLFVSAHSSAAREEVSLFVAVAGCLSDTPMLQFGHNFVLWIRVACGNLDNQTVTVTSSGGGLARARIR